MSQFATSARNPPIFMILALAIALWLTPAHGTEPVIQAEPLIVSQDHAWPPFAFRDKDGQPRGLLVDLWQEIGQRLGRPVEFRLVDWPDSIQQVREGLAHVHGGLIPSPEREAFLDFSAELLPLQTFLFVSSGSLVMGLDDLHGIPVGVTEGSYEAEFMGREHPDIELRPFRNNERMILAAVDGEIQAFVADYPVGLYLLDRHATPADFRPLAALYVQPLVAAVQKGDEKLLQAIEATLADFDPEERRRLMQRWIRSEKVEVLPAWLLISIVAIFLLLLLGLYSLMLYRQRRQLAREVAERTADLRASEAQFRALVENANDIIYALSPAGVFTYVSPNWKEILGHDPEEVVGQSFERFVQPEDLAKCHAFLRRVIESGEKQGGIEYRVRHQDGDWRWHTSNASPIQDAAGKIVFYMGIARDITDRKELETRMMHLAHYDPLTDLPNRLLFFDRVEQALISARRTHAEMALMLLDLDEFKPVNDEHGHAIGDLLLQESAQRMKACLRASDTVARVGGDEFLILLPEIAHEQDAVQVAEKLRSELARPFLVEGRQLQISCSIGIALYPEHGASAIELVRFADHAMYLAKHQGRNAWRIFRDEKREPETEEEAPC